MLQKFKQELHSLANSEKAKILQGFFKTGIGEYGEGDIFLGVTVPIQRKLVKKYYKDLNFKDIQKLLNSKIHEERFCGVISLVEKYKISNFESKKDVYEFYLKNTRRINNWDLVDLSAPNIVGDFLFNNFVILNKIKCSEESKIIDSSLHSEGQKEDFELIDCQASSKGQGNKDILYKLARNENLWERRIAIISTFTFIRRGKFTDTINIVEILLTDKHDLIQKACGWMLREVGKRDLDVLRNFLDKNITNMPRTMLRYAIEKLSENERKFYLGK